jgi:rhomboid protease GluP
MEGRGLLDRAVDLLARAMDAVGLNGTRLRWQWNQRRRDLGESGMRAEILLRSARAPHKMCPSCRALVPRSARRCPECDAGLASVRAPGIGRLVGNVLPGATAATSLLLLTNGALFILMLMSVLSAGRGAGLLGAFDGITLIRFGSGFNPLTVGAGEWWRLVTPIFLHGGLLHFAFNSYALIQLGPIVEQEYGTERFSVLYLVTGVAGNLASQVLWPGVRHTVGASGAICGLIGLLLAYGWRRGGTAGAGIRASMARSAIYLLVFSLLPGVDLLCHLGGFVAGLGLGLVVPAGPFRGRASAAVWNGLLLACLTLVLWSFYQVARHGPEAVRLLTS